MKPDPTRPYGPRSRLQDRLEEPARPWLIGLGLDELEALCRSCGASSVHAERILAHLHRRGNFTLEGLRDLPRSLAATIAERTRIIEPRLTESDADEDGTSKLALRLDDGAIVESVLIPASGRITQCVSTQVGCALGCRFCKTATLGLSRHLQAAEMVAQVLVGRSRMPVRNLVLMGMGEPLHNYDEVARFVRLAAEPKGLGFSPNRITLSTVGLVPGILRMTEDRLPCNLAVSLNATTDEVRSRIMPVNRKYPLTELMDAVRAYAAETGRRVLIEYVLLAGVNDDDRDCARLIALLDGLDCTINLLPFNPWPGAGFARPTEARVSAFRKRLIEAGFVAVVRESRGRRIAAACGMLAGPGLSKSA